MKLTPTTGKRKARIAIYIRYSSENQRDGYSVEYQLDECKKYIKEQDGTFIRAYIDEAISGKSTDKRSAFFELLADVKRGLYDAVVVYKYSRFARNLVEASIYRQQIEKNGVKLISAMERIDDSTPEGRMMRNIIMVMDEYYSDNLGTFVSSSMHTAAKNGKFLGGQPPFGYKLDENGAYEIHPQEAEIVKSIFELYANHYSFSDILRWLDSRGHKTRKGNNFSLSGIYVILRNEKYIGRYEYNVKGYDTVIIDNAFTPIIDMTLWHRVQQRHAAQLEKEKPAGRVKKRVYPLTGKIKCALCDNSYIGNSKTSYTRKDGSKYECNYYVCRGKIRKRICNAHAIRKEELENFVISKVKDFILNDQSIKEMTEKVYSIVYEQNGDIEADLKELRKEKAKLERQEESLLDLMLDGEISKSVLKKKTENIRGKLADVEKQLEYKQLAEATTVTRDMVSGYLRQLLGDLENGDDDLKKAVLDQMVKEIVISEDKVDVVLGFNYNYFFRDNDQCGGAHFTLSQQRKGAQIIIEE